MPTPPVEVIYQPPGALVTTRREQEELYGPGAVAAGLAIYGFAEDHAWAKWVGGGALAVLAWKWWQKQQEIKRLQPKTIVDVLTQANKDALAAGLTGAARQQFLYKAVADAFGEDQAKQAVPAMAGADHRRRPPARDDTDEPPGQPGGMNGL